MQNDRMISLEAKKEDVAWFLIDMFGSYETLEKQYGKKSTMMDMYFYVKTMIETDYPNVVMRNSENISDREYHAIKMCSLYLWSAFHSFRRVHRKGTVTVAPKVHIDMTKFYTHENLFVHIQREWIPFVGMAAHFADDTYYKMVKKVHQRWQCFVEEEEMKEPKDRNKIKMYEFLYRQYHERMMWMTTKVPCSGIKDVMIDELTGFVRFQMMAASFEMPLCNFVRMYLDLWNGSYKFGDYEFYMCKIKPTGSSELKNLFTVECIPTLTAKCRIQNQEDLFKEVFGTEDIKFAYTVNEDYINKR